MAPKRAKQSGAGIVDTAKDILKATKVISTVLSAMPNPIAKGLGTIARMKGYGKKKAVKRKKPQKGKGFFSDLGQGIGGAAYGIGGGIGNIAHGMFGSGHIPAVLTTTGIMANHRTASQLV